MSQKLIANQPVKVVTDKVPNKMGANEATYIKNYRILFNKNQNNQGKEGGNQLSGTGLRSTKKIPLLFLPAGKNIKMMEGEAKETNRIYVGFWNEFGNHGIYRINGDDQSVEIVIIDSRLNFSSNPKHAIPDHRVIFTPVYGSDDNDKRYLKDEIIMFTDAYNWQFWINTESCIATGGYDATAFPYYTLHAPHYDFEELIQWAFRPPPFDPTVAAIPRTPEDVGLPNYIDKQTVQFAYTYIYTDGRKTTLSPFSMPYTNTRTGCSNNDRTTPRCLKLGLYAGGPSVEAVELLTRACGGDWKKYDTIYKYSKCGVNDPVVIGDKYWLRKNPWEDLNYDATTNTFEYVYCGNKECTPYSVDDANRIESDLPILTTAMAKVADSVLHADILRDYDNLGCEVADNVEIKLVKEELKAACPVNLVNIKLYSIISRADQTAQFLWKNGPNGEVKFGGLYLIGIGGPAPSTQTFDPAEADAFGLRLGENKGLICYLAGTPYIGTPRQYQVNVSSHAKTEIGVIDISDPTQVDFVKDVIFTNTSFFIQEYEFNVPAGNYIARLARHDADTASDYQKTSTYVRGIINYNIPGTNGVDSRVMNDAKEIVINACAGDYDGYEGSKESMFYLHSPYTKFLSEGSGVEENGRFIEGYLRESADTKLPIEYVLYRANKGGALFNFDGRYTDHNGFFYSQSAGGDARHSQVDFFGKFNCENANPNQANFSTAINSDNKGYFPKQDLYAKIGLGNNYGDCNRILVKGSIKDCSTKLGLAGVGITLQGSQTFYTDAEGNFVLVVHPLPTGLRSGKIFYNAGGECSFVACDCSCIITDDFNEGNAPGCTSCNYREYPLAFNKEVRLTSYTETSLKDGGRYAVSVRAKEHHGRGTYVKTIGYYDVPTTMELGATIPTKLSFNLLPGFKLPKEFKYMSFAISNNLNNKRYIQWLGDQIKFVDGQGNESKSGNGAVLAKVYIQSLLDFNKDNNFSTNTGYQFSPGDRIRFYDDGRGNIFKPTLADGFVEYEIRGTDFNYTEDQIPDDETYEGRSLIIDYDSRLLKLKDKCGFWFEIISPRVCEDLETYCEIPGSTIPVINGVPQISSGLLKAFDTYYINRNIILKSCSGNTQTHPFASPSVNDFKSGGCNSCGRVLIKDEKVEQKWYKTETIKSDDLVNDGRVNGLGTFRFSNRKTFKGQQWGGIVAMHAERGIIAVICENDWFTCSYDQEFVKVNASGILQSNLENKISNAGQKIGDLYGCAFEDTSTIDFFDGVFVWADVKNAAILISNYQSLGIISDIDNAGYWTDKLKYVNAHDSALSEEDYLTNLFERNGKIDPKTKCYHLTFRPRRKNSPKVSAFIDNEIESFVDMQETLVFDIKNQAWLGNSSFTPEGYARLAKSTTAKEFISFVNAVPYYHNDNSVNTVNTFYGVKCDIIIETVFVGEEIKDKRYQRFAVGSSDASYFIDSIHTSERKQYSYVPENYVNKKGSTFYSKLLMNTNVYPDPNRPIVSTLIDGGILSGEFIKAKFIRNRNFIDIYTELNYLWVGYIDREKSKS